MKKGILSFLFVCSALHLSSQSFELEQVQQVWRPRIKADFRYVGNANYKDTSGHFSYTDQNCVITFPIKTKLSADLKLDLSSIRLKDILSKSVTVHASQLMGNVKFGAKQLHAGLDSISNRNLYNASAGLFGLKLTKKFRILFYSVNAGFNEQDKTLDRMALRASGVIGQFHLRGLRKNYYYGLAASYTDGVFAPIPFFGGMAPVSERLTFSYTLPAQLCMQYRIDKNNTISYGITLDGFRYGMLYNKERINMNYASLALFTTYRVKVNKTLGFRLNGGYNIVQRVKLNNTSAPMTNYRMNRGFFIEAGFYTLFGKNLFEQAANAINDNVL
jgi:hypothetical protein